MNIRAWRETIYLEALEHNRRAQALAKADPRLKHIEVVTADEFRWIESLTVDDLIFLKVQKIRATLLDVDLPLGGKAPGMPTSESPD